MVTGILIKDMGSVARAYMIVMGWDKDEMQFLTGKRLSDDRENTSNVGQERWPFTRSSDGEEVVVPC